MKHLYLWYNNQENYHDLCFSEDAKANLSSITWIYAGKYKTKKSAKNAWILLGRKTTLTFIPTYEDWWITDVTAPVDQK